MPSAFTRYAIFPDGIAGLGAGFRFVTAKVGWKWVMVRTAGASRSRRIPRRTWDNHIPHVAYTGQTTAELLEMLRPTITGGKPSCHISNSCTVTPKRGPAGSAPRRAPRGRNSRRQK